MTPKTAAVLTISDSSFERRRQDLSGPAVVRLLESAGFKVVHTSILPDEKDVIAARMIECSEVARLVVTTGGTGIAVRDVTPEATLSVAERLVDGIPERIRREGSKKTPLAALSRGICATRGKALLLNLPGSPAAATESLQSVLEILPHALELLSGNTSHAGE
ncbi:MAG TPA: MogA/MoaB family molybdenum cofactor biosynthesis protein [Candidatus Angelobacter sp.]|nr:MogA/MoaB family molybdenum cofactor biosynthesis protein [Candidatus Angelobacter sp.]